MLKILIVSNLYAPDSCGGAAIFTDLAQGLAENGHAVTVRCAYPYYPEWRDKRRENGFKVKRDYLNGVNVERYGLYIPAKPQRFSSRLMHEGSFFLSLSRSLFHGSFDAAIVFCPMLASVAFGGIASRLRGIPAILCVQDLPTGAASAAGILKSRRLAAASQAAEDLLFSQFKAIRTIHRVMADRLDDRRVRVIPDWLPRRLEELIASLAVHRRPTGPCKLFYSGNIGSKQGLLDFCKSLSKSASKFSFAIRGEGAEAGTVRDWVLDSGDRRFTFEPLASEDAFIESLVSADFFVVTEKPNAAAFFPSKVISAMAAGTPILAISDPDSPLGSEMREHGLGPWFSWDRHHDVDAMLKDKPCRTTWRENLARRQRFYSRTACLGQFERLLKEVL